MVRKQLNRANATIDSSRDLRVLAPVFPGGDDSLRHPRQLVAVAANMLRSDHLNGIPHAHILAGVFKQPGHNDALDRDSLRVRGANNPTVNVQVILL